MGVCLAPHAPEIGNPSTDPGNRASGARKPEGVEGMRMEARRAKTCRNTGLGLRQPPPLGHAPTIEHPKATEQRADRTHVALHLKRKDHKSYAAPSRRGS
jgi:hypothetical protein